MSVVAGKVEALRRRIETLNEADMPANALSRLAVTPVADGFDLDFYGDSFGESYIDLMSTVGLPEIAPHIRSLVLRGPDEGANGTQNWDLEPLLAKEASFSRLESLAIQQNKPGNHNRSVVGEGYEEAGVLGRLLASAPLLRELSSPSAPSSNFFEVSPRPMRHLSIDAGYATNSFIHNLAKSAIFGELMCLEWGEYNETYQDEFRDCCTPYEEYEALFRSRAFSPVRRFVWRNPVCSDVEMRALKQLKPDLQLLVVRTSAEYLR